MALKNFGGGGGGAGGFVPGSHTEEVDTIAHWPFQGDRGDTVGTYDLDQGYFGFGGVADNALCMATGTAYCYDNSASTSLNPNLNTDNKYTFACGLYIPSIVSGSADIVRYEVSSGGGTAFRVGVLGTGGGTPGAPYLGADTSAGYAQDVMSTPLPLDQWFHFAFTINAAGTGGTFYVNGAVLEAWTLPNAMNSTSSSARFGIGRSWNTVGYFSYFSMIVREKECSTAEILAMAAQCGF